MNVFLCAYVLLFLWCACPSVDYAAIAFIICVDVYT